jgi:three-Cys-motif partner protein
VAVPKDTLWPIEPHTVAKHQILRKYLDAWLPILGTYNNRMLYIDGFAGPGEYAGGEPGSPIIALEAALNHHAYLAGELYFVFVEERSDRVAHLKQRIDALHLPRHFKIDVFEGTFAGRMAMALRKMDAAQGNVPPSFALIDPFGFSGIPYDLIQRFLAKSRCEVLITVMVDSINRWLTHPEEKVRAEIVETFGTDEALQIAFGRGDREQALKDLYQWQLRKAARFVRYFDMRNSDNRTIYYLFFAGNNRLGHLKMKEAMWKIDRLGDFRFSDATDPNQTLLFDAPSVAPLADELSAKFRGAGQQSVQVVETHVEDDTAYLKKHMREALLQLETAGRLQVAALKSDGKARRAKTFPKEAVVTFL